MTFDKKIPGWDLHDPEWCANMVVPKYTETTTGDNDMREIVTHENGTQEALISMDSTNSIIPDEFVEQNINAATPVDFTTMPIVGPLMYTQADMDRATAEVRAEYAAQIQACQVTQTQQASAIRKANNDMYAYVAKVGEALSELVQEHDLMAKESDVIADLFSELGIEDYLPVREYLVEVTFEGKTWVHMEAHNEEAARVKVSRECGAYEIIRAIKDNDTDIDTWETSGEVDVY